MVLNRARNNINSNGMKFPIELFSLCRCVAFITGTEKTPLQVPSVVLLCIQCSNCIPNRSWRLLGVYIRWKTKDKYVWSYSHYLAVSFDHYYDTANVSKKPKIKKKGLFIGRDNSIKIKMLFGHYRNRGYQGYNLANLKLPSKQVPIYSDTDFSSSCGPKKE